MTLTQIKSASVAELTARLNELVDLDNTNLRQDYELVRIRRELFERKWK